MVDLVSDEVTMAQTFTREEPSQSNVSVGFLKPLAKHWVVLTVFRLLKLKKIPVETATCLARAAGEILT